MKGFIYVIKSKQTTNVYYGSTKKSLDRRLQGHQSDYRKYLKGNMNYITSYELIQYDDAFIELIETIEYENKEELKKREGYYIQNNDCVNKLIAGRTKKETNKEYRENNKESILEKKKEWYEANKEYVLERQKEYREDNKESISEKKKEYRENNKESISEKKKEWYEANKEYVLEKRKEHREKNRDKYREYDRLRYLKKKESLL